MESRYETVDSDEELLRVEGVVDVDERAETIPETEPIDFFGTDFDVHGLVRRLDTGDILIPSFDPPVEEGVDLAGFQRRFVWRKYQMDRFIESLLLGYPVPGIFLVQQPDKKLLVLDGQQRLRTLQAYYHGRLGKDRVFKLENVSRAFKGAAYDELSPEDRRSLDNAFIRATVVKYDPDDEGGAESIYQLFERLNTGGTNLYPQEIRVALYNGGLVDLLRELNSERAWRELYGSVSERLKDQELILRFIAFYTSADEYERPLKRFLNEFLRSHRNLEGLDSGQIRRIFDETCETVERAIGRRAFRPTKQINAALVDSLMVGVARRLAKGPVTAPAELELRYDELVGDESFQNSIARATADEERVATRLGRATAAFSDVP